MKSDDCGNNPDFEQKNPSGIIDASEKIHFGERLKDAIGSEAVRSFSRKCGLSEATLRDYLKGSSFPTIDRLARIASAANVSIFWLIGIDDAEPASVLGEVKLTSEFYDEFALIPGYRVQVSAGHGAIAPDGEEPCRYLAFRRKWLKWRGFSENDLVIVWCKGESMEPAIYNNDTLVVHISHDLD